MTVGDLRRIIANVPDECEIGMYGGELQTLTPVNAVIPDVRDLDYKINRVVFFRDPWGMGRRPVTQEPIKEVEFDPRLPLKPSDLMRKLLMGGRKDR
jgi:hypothetical protein